MFSERGCRIPPGQVLHAEPLERGGGAQRTGNPHRQRTQHRGDRVTIGPNLNGLMLLVKVSRCIIYSRSLPQCNVILSLQSGNRSRTKGNHSCNRLGKALFPLYSGAMRHDCLANTRAVVKEDTEATDKFALRLELRARVVSEILIDPYLTHTNHKNSSHIHPSRTSRRGRRSRCSTCPPSWGPTSGGGGS